MKSLYYQKNFRYIFIYTCVSFCPCYKLKDYNVSGMSTQILCSNSLKCLNIFLSRINMQILFHKLFLFTSISVKVIYILSIPRKQTSSSFLCTRGYQWCLVSQHSFIFTFLPSSKFSMSAFHSWFFHAFFADKTSTSGLCSYKFVLSEIIGLNLY